MEGPIVNKVAQSELITLDLEQYFPSEPTAIFDLKDHLFMGLILKEKDFREALKQTDWEQYRGKHVAITCSADAIIPVWAYMLVTSYLEPVALQIVAGTEQDLHRHLFMQKLSALPVKDYSDKRVVIKGCADVEIGPFAYAEATRLLRPVVKSLMYGEPCSTVPVYKKAVQR
ncbi:DUF2480 family protein [Nostoc ellipsosporum NOK]|nr:DUF2480 family protein [Nostoc ellipsosporum NOK]